MPRTVILLHCLVILSNYCLATGNNDGFQNSSNSRNTRPLQDSQNHLFPYSINYLENEPINDANTYPPPSSPLPAQRVYTSSTNQQGQGFIHGHHDSGFYPYGFTPHHLQVIPSYSPNYGQGFSSGFSLQGGLIDSSVPNSSPLPDYSQTNLPNRYLEGVPIDHTNSYPLPTPPLPTQNQFTRRYSQEATYSQRSDQEFPSGFPLENESTAPYSLPSPPTGLFNAPGNSYAPQRSWLPAQNQPTSSTNLVHEGMTHVNQNAGLFDSTDTQGHRFSSEKTKALEDAFRVYNYLNKAEKEKLAGEIGLREDQVEKWFSNRRHRLKEKEKKAGAAAGDPEKLEALRNEKARKREISRDRVRG